MGPGDDESAVQPVIAEIDGRSLRPLAPVHLRTTVSPDGDVGIVWVRRSRLGFDWIDGGETPLGEERERYRVRIGDGAGRLIESETSAITYAHADRLVDGFGSPLRIEVRQLGAGVGAGDAIVQHVLLPPP